MDLSMDTLIMANLVEAMEEERTVKKLLILIVTPSIIILTPLMAIHTMENLVVKFEIPAQPESLPNTKSMLTQQQLTLFDILLCVQGDMLVQNHMIIISSSHSILC
jgi:hypothetical protein